MEIRLIIFLLSFVFLAAGCGQSAMIDSKKDADANELKIAVVYMDNASSDYSYAHMMGIQKMQRKLSLKERQITNITNIYDTDSTMAENALSEAIAGGVKLIITTSQSYMNICNRLAQKYPNVIFVNAGGYKSNEKNLTNYFGRVYQARYLSGIVAGLKTKSNKIGYVAAMDRSSSGVTSELNAFAMGVESVNPQAKIYVRVTNSWFDPAGERQAARLLIGAGCDVLGQTCDTNGPQMEAEKAKVYGIGYNIDMQSAAPEAVLTSIVWNWEVYYTYLVESILSGTFTTTPYYAGMAEGLFDLAPLNEFLTTPAMCEAVEKARERMLYGDFNVFDGVLETNDGHKIGQAGTTLSDREITTGIHWYYRNITRI